MNPRPTIHSLVALYTNAYYTGKSEYIYCDERTNKLANEILYQSRIRFLEKQLGRRGALLDVGCSYGGLLRVAQSMHWDIAGVDVSDDAAHFASRVLGCTVHRGELNSSEFRDGSFTCINMVETIEHLPHPLEDITKCFQLLQPGGILLVQTGNYQSLDARLHKNYWNYFLPGHVVIYSPKSIRRLLNKAGFRKIQIFSGDTISFFDRVRCVHATATTPANALRYILTWGAISFLRVATFRQPVLSSMTVVARRE